MTALSCRLGWHTWARWGESVPCQYERPAFTVMGFGLTSASATETVEFTVFEQSRSCTGCGISQRREVSRA
jgi:hypothetical protein